MIYNIMCCFYFLVEIILSTKCPSSGKSFKSTNFTHVSTFALQCFIVSAIDFQFFDIGGGLTSRTFNGINPAADDALLSIEISSINE